MKKIALTAIAIAALGVGACQGTAGNNAAANTHNNAAEHDANTSAGHDNTTAGTTVDNTLDAAGNGLSRAGDVIENTASQAYNEVREVGRDIGDGSDRNNGNTTGR